MDNLNITRGDSSNELIIKDTNATKSFEDTSPGWNIELTMKQEIALFVILATIVVSGLLTALCWRRKTKIKVIRKNLINQADSIATDDAFTSRMPSASSRHHNQDVYVFPIKDQLTLHTVAVDPEILQIHGLNKNNIPSEFSRNEFTRSCRCPCQYRPDYFLFNTIERRSKSNDYLNKNNGFVEDEIFDYRAPYNFRHSFSMGHSKHPH